jgi:hypothetical protein
MQARIHGGAELIDDLIDELQLERRAAILCVLRRFELRLRRRRECDLRFDLVHARLHRVDVGDDLRGAQCACARMSTFIASQRRRCGSLPRSKKCPHA